MIEISSHLDYENLVANILYEYETVAIISQEKGIENLELEILLIFEKIPWKFSFENFLSTLLFAKKTLIEPQKLPED